MTTTNLYLNTTWHISAGFVSGITSSLLLQPLDLLKTRIQQNRHTTLRTSIQQLHSIADAWRGTVPSLLRTSIGGALYFGMLNGMRTMLSNTVDQRPSDQRLPPGSSSRLPRLSMGLNLVSGAVSRATIGFIAMPITIIKVWMESVNYRGQGMSQAVEEIYRKSGIPGFYKGYGVTCARDAPYAGLYVLFYEKNKDFLNAWIPQSNYGAVINSASAASAAAMATTITGPFDTIKTRIQLDPVKYKSFVTAGWQVVSEDGLVRLFDGLSLRLARKALSSGIGWMIYEEIVKKAK